MHIVIISKSFRGLPLSSCSFRISSWVGTRTSGEREENEWLTSNYNAARPIAKRVSLSEFEYASRIPRLRKSRVHRRKKKTYCLLARVGKSQPVLRYQQWRSYFMPQKTNSFFKPGEKKIENDARSQSEQGRAVLRADDNGGLETSQ